MSDPLTGSYDAAFARARDADTEVYGELHGVALAGHHRRMELLSQLALGDLGAATVVDYGVGPWGFAAVFPALWRCRKAIGIDISEVALRASRDVTLAAQHSFGADVEFLQSRGDELPLPDASVDVLFAGEAIEHVELPSVFLDEIARVLRDDGQLVLTTPNAQAATYVGSGEEYAIGPEHIALMPYRQLLDVVGQRFDIVDARGYNTSLHHTVDATLEDALAERWAAQFEREPQFATGVILHARRRPGARPRRRVQRRYAAAGDFATAGTWANCHLHEQLWGIWSDAPDSTVSFQVPAGATTAAILFWAHAWSGTVELSVDAEVRTVDLFSPQGGFRRVEIATGGDRGGGTEVVLRPTGNPHPRSHGAQVIVFAAYWA